ncbi:autotransporter outer membrane beta-barrel domain-containing protein [Pseudovibrio sp. JE062]|uniref:autotransporter family protein n=1 Tax=Pseudovibrio sp. JE062 TaxID=439495 RepID=UPI000186C04C|nr:autotransporter outer membrane beta-barrel domain-containing protein [Pseudovibrio sp. JE062]EEA95120.1 outer membrane autotransporter, putative [Pseudovibrio sp. JE062]
MTPNSLFRTSLALPVLLLPHSLFAGEVINDGSIVVGSPTVVDQVTIADGTTLEVQAGASIEVGTAHAVTHVIDWTTITVINAGSISTTDNLYDAINNLEATLHLENSGIIYGMEDAVDTGDASYIENSGTLHGGDEGILARGRIEELINSGTILAERDDGVQAEEIGSFTNSGTITSLTDDGILLLDSAGVDSFINSGSISAYDRGLFARHLGYFYNSGDISAGREAVQIEGDGQTVINHGSLNSEFDNGVDIWSLDSFINTGTITTGGYGLLLDGEDGSGYGRSVYNSGTITSEGTGIRATHVERLVNTGTIFSESSAIELDHGTIINSGSLTGDWEAAVRFSQDEATGAATLINSGLIRNVYSPANAAILFEAGGPGHLVLAPGSVIIGTIDMAGTEDTLTVENGLSIANTFIGTPEAVEANGAAYAVSGNQVAVADTSGLAAVDNAFVDLTNSIAEGVNTRLSGLTRQRAGSGVPAAEAPEQSRGLWFSGFGGGSRWKGTGATTENTHGYGGILVGLDGQFRETQYLGAFVGTSIGRTLVSHDSQETEITSVFGGIYGQQQFDNHALSFILSGGYSEYDSDRSVANNTVATGTETASADYGSWFILPELTYATELSILQHTLLPSVSLRYAGGTIHGFTESGSDGNLSVDDRDIHEFTGRIRLAVRAFESAPLFVEGFVALEGRLSRGDNTLNGALLGQDIGFDLDGRDEALRGYIGLNAGGEISTRTNWFARAEAATGSDVDVHGEGQAGLSIRF